MRQMDFTHSADTPYASFNELTEVFARLEALTDDDRMLLFMQYCGHCGRDDPRCQCWNDE